MSIKPSAAEPPAEAAAEDSVGGRHDAAAKPQDVAGEDKAGIQDGVATPAVRPKEIGGPPGPEPTRYGDWQFNGRVTDF